jgi:low temperature requirement protein LtrA
MTDLAGDSASPKPPVPSEHEAAHADAQRGKVLGTVALVYGVAALAFELYFISAASTVMEDNTLNNLLPILPVVIVVGLVLFIVTAFFGKAARKRATIGGFLMAAPFLVFLLVMIVSTVGQ